MTINWEPLRPIIAEHQRFVLSSHVRPDADALGSELGMAALLEGMGKQVRIVNPSSSPANLLFLDPTQRVKKLGEGMTSAEALDTEVHVILDTSRVGTAHGTWQRHQAHQSEEGADRPPRQLG